MDAEANASNPYAKYQTDPIAYAEEVMHLSPWPGRVEKGQRELFADIGESVRRQLAGEPADKIFRVEAGHGVGKTYGAAMLVNWFFDSFAPSITYTTAPTRNQVVDLLWKNIKALRPAGLPGRVLPSEPRMVKSASHWAVGRTTSDSGGKGTERFQGQHDKFLFFLIDEAEGVPPFVFSSIRAMMTKATVMLWLLLANPRTRSSEFFKLGRSAGVRNYRLSVLDHPNVVDGSDVVPGATGREWVIQCILDWCEPVTEHDADSYTFTVGYPVAEHPAGTIFRPNTEFLFRVMGVAPSNVADDTFVPVGRYEAACKRAPLERDPSVARIGIDAAGYGNDLGTVFARWNGRIWRAAQCSKLAGDQDPTDYWQKTRKVALALKEQGVTNLHIRIDAGGGFGNGVYDRLKRDLELVAAFAEFRLHLVHFNGSPRNDEAYADLGTEMYAHAGESLKGLAVLKPPQTLEEDLCERRYQWVNRAGVEVRQLEPKRIFKRTHGRSPDDGDGFVLAAGPDFLYEEPVSRVVRPEGAERSRYRMS